MKCKSFVTLGLLAIAATLLTHSPSARAEDDREPASQKRPVVESTPTNLAPNAGTAAPTEGSRNNEEAYRRDLPRDVYIPKFQYNAMLGLGLNSSDDMNNDDYQHKVARSPVALAGFHYAFFRQKHFNMLLGADVIYIRSVDVASSSRATATYTSENVDGGVTLGLGWVPGNPNSKFQLQGKIGSGFNISHNAQLQSPGFSSSIDSSSATSNVLSFWAELSAVYLPTPNWRILGTVLAVSKTQALLGGVAYAY